MWALAAVSSRSFESPEPGQPPSPEPWTRRLYGSPKALDPAASAAAMWQPVALRTCKSYAPARYQSPDPKALVSKP